MARNIGPTWRISRRLNFSILETGEELTKRPYIPGQHGSAAKRVKQSNYGLQKAEKQKLRHLLNQSLNTVTLKILVFQERHLIGAYLFLLIKVKQFMFGLTL